MWPLLVCCLLAPIARAADAAVILPEPVLLLSFESALDNPLAAQIPGGIVEPSFPGTGTAPHIAPRQGAGFGDCLDFTQVAASEIVAAPVYESAELAKRLSGAKYLTITGWYRVKPEPDGAGHDYAFASQLLRMYFHDRTKDVGALELMGAKRRTTLWSTCHAVFVSADRWVFYAYTYDGSSSGKNCLSYSGNEDLPVQRNWTASSPMGALGTTDTLKLVLGAHTAKGDLRYRGMLDNLRIFASRGDPRKGVLTLAQLEAVRQLDLGPDWERAAKTRAAEAKARQLKEKKEGEVAWLRHHEELFGTRSLGVMQVDPLQAVYPDRIPEPLEPGATLDLPRGGSGFLAFALSAARRARVEVECDQPKSATGEVLDLQWSVFHAQPVHVEANTNGGARTRVDRSPPTAWFTQLTRRAPFDVCEILTPTTTMDVEGRNTHLAMIDVTVPPNATAGLYQGRVRFGSGAEACTADFKIQVHPVAAPQDYDLHVTIWLDPSPVTLTRSRPAPEWWSEQHWDCIQATAETMRRYGQDAILTPVLKGEHSLTDAVRIADGTYVFGFQRFDRWVELFLATGFRQIHGRHIGQWGNGYGMNEKTGKREVFLRGSGRSDEEFRFVRAFARALNQHLDEKGWKPYYQQHILDEPVGKSAYYTKMSTLIHEQMPGVPIMDALHKNFDIFEPLIDQPTFIVHLLAENTPLLTRRSKADMPFWYYNSCAPLPPMPNRHLDDLLTSSRLYPILGYWLGATGYLNWGANIYRGADPRQTSIGPLPNGSQMPGHPPGDNWLYYPVDVGLVGSVRMAAFRDGLLDHALLTRLKGIDANAATRIRRSLVRSMRDFERDPKPYHEARRQMLARLAKDE